MKVTCPSCQTENPLGTQFCISCGEELPDQAVAVSLSAAPPPTATPTGPSVNLTLVRIGKVKLGEADAAHLQPKIFTVNFGVDKKEVTIGGRDSTRDPNFVPDVDLVEWIAFYGAFVSRRQAKIVWNEAENTYAIVQESDKNQTMVIPVDADGKPEMDKVVTCELDPVAIKEGDNLLLGNCRFVFHVNATLIA